MAMLMASSGFCGNWHGSLRSKVQVDNRYTLKQAHVFGELWGQGFYDDDREDLHGAFDFVTRSGAQPDGGGTAKLYQAFVEKGFRDLHTRIKLGRFQRTDNLGFYLVDGGGMFYGPAGGDWSIEAYAGHPTRFDHAIAVEGKFIGGLEGRGRWLPDWGLSKDMLTLNRIDVRGGYQYFLRDLSQDPAEDVDLVSPADGGGGVDVGALLGATDLTGALPASFSQASAAGSGDSVQRLYFAGEAGGRLGLWRNSDYDLGVLGTYRADRGRFENLLVRGLLDLTDTIRFRGHYEYYHPRDPILTFREKFYSVYAFGEQTFARARIHVAPTEEFNYYLGGLTSNRQGFDGLGGEFGLNYALTPNFSVLGEFDYLSLGPENATSFYTSAIHTANSRLTLRLNTALRFETKQLYGANRAVGAEIEAFYMLRNDLVLNIAGSYVWYTRILDEYLAAVQLIYYFDHFKPKEKM